MPSSLILNLDESGFQRYADATHNRVIVKKGTKQAVYPVSRSERRATFLSCIAAAGNRLKPLVIVPRKTLDSELLIHGYSSDIVVFAHSETGYITSSIFEDYIAEVVVPYLTHQKAALGYSGRSVITMDNCSCNRTDRTQTLLEAAGGIIVWLPPNGSDQTQACDLGIFGNMKAAQSRIHPPSGMSLQSQQLYRMISAYDAIAFPGNVTAAFRRAGVSNRIVDVGE